MSENTTSKNLITLGKIAYNWLLQSSRAVVWGNTSTGLFLNIQPDQIIFLTSSDHIGPVNIIIRNKFPTHWANKDKIQIIHQDNEFTLFNQQDKLQITIDNIWHTPIKPPGRISPDEQRCRLLQSANQISLLKNGQGFAPLLIPFLRNEPPEDLEDAWLSQSWDKIIHLKQSLLNKDIGKVFSVSKQLVGSGRGLTPSGDDLLTGLFFMHKRWFKNTGWMDEMEQSLAHEFQQHTTAVSSTLFWCALHGEADARIQELSDALMTSEIPFHQQAIQLARWGNSSGADVFLGMLLAIASFQNQSEG